MGKSRNPIRNDIVQDATEAAVCIIVEYLDMLPADKGRIAVFLADVVYAAIESAILLDRRERLTPSDN